MVYMRGYMRMFFIIWYIGGYCWLDYWFLDKMVVIGWIKIVFFEDVVMFYYGDIMFNKMKMVIFIGGFVVFMFGVLYFIVVYLKLYLEVYSKLW